MPDKKEETQQVKQETPAFMSGIRAWIILGAVAITEALFFLVILHYSGQEPVSQRNESSGSGSITSTPNMRIKADELNKSPTHDIRGLTTTKIDTSGRTRTLIVDIKIIMEPLPNEIKLNTYPTEEDYSIIKRTVENMDSFTKDLFIKFVDERGINSLETSRGKEELRSYFKQRINDALERIDLQLSRPIFKNDRVTRIDFTRFMFTE